MKQPVIETLLGDDVDPAPRILRMVAAAFAVGDTSTSADTAHGRLRLMARMLEGESFGFSVLRKAWMKQATSERRVRRRRAGTLELVVKGEDKPHLSREDERHRRQMQEAGDE